MKELLSQRYHELKMALEQSANNHNALVGRMAEVQYLMDQCLKQERETEKQEMEEKPEENIPAT